MGQNEPECATNPDELDRRIATSLLSGPKKSDDQLAQALGISRRTLTRRKHSPEVQHLVKEALLIPSDEIRRLVVKGLTKLEEHMDSDDPRISLAAAAHMTKLASQVLEQLIGSDEERTQEQITYTAHWGGENTPE